MAKAKTKKEKKFSYEKTNAWKTYAKDEKKIEQISDEYRNFLDMSKTERTSVDTIISFLKKDGYKEFDKIKSFKPGTKLYMVNKKKSMVAGILGKNDMIKNGVNYIVSHIDVPMLHLKPNPIYEDEKMVLAKTQYYGGVKKHHWINIPLAIYGVVYLKDGKEVRIKFGDDGKNAVVIPDLAIHISKGMAGRKESEVIKGEELNVLLGSKPVYKKGKGKDAKEEELLKENILSILNKEYGIEERDIITGEFQVVPALPALNIGMDSSMIGGFGHDDRVCAYASLRALIDMKKPKNTVLSYWFDREEIGSTGNTGAQSIFFEYFIGLLLEKTNKTYNDLMLKRTLTNSFGISADVAPAVDSTFKGAYDPRNSARLGYGPLFHKYTGGRGKGGSNEASPEFLTNITRLLDENKIPWQLNCLGKVDGGGGGTIANYLCNLNTEVLDSGVPLLGLHSPYEIISKVDLYATIKAYIAFMEDFA